MTKHEQILEALNITPRTYNNFRDIQFEEWCTNYSMRFGIPRRALVVNEHLHSWYCTQWIKTVEERFYNKFNDYITNRIGDVKYYRDVFNDYPTGILHVYPIAIIKTIKQEITFINNEIIHKTRVGKQGEQTKPGLSKPNFRKT